MNYIKSLQSELSNKNNELKVIEEELSHLLSYLRSDKFMGFDNNYVNATEMAERIQKLLQIVRFPEMNNLITY